MLDKLGTKGIAGVVSLPLGIGIITSQTPVVAAGLIFVVAGPGLAIGDLAGGAMGIFGMA